MAHDAALHDLAAKQQWLLSAAQAAELGLSRSAFRRRIERGSFYEVHPSVVSLSPGELTFERRALAATLAVGPGSLASHLTATRLWVPNLEVPEREIEVIALGRGRSPELDGVIVHRPTDRKDLVPHRRGGVPSCSPLRTAVDVAAIASEDVLTDAIESMLIARLVSVAALRAAASRHAKPGRAGCGVLRAYLDERALGDRPADSVVEATVGALLRAVGLVEWTFQHRIVVGGSQFRLDFAFCGARLDVEFDGFRWHGDRLAFERDRARDAELAASGWVVLRFTWLQVVQRPQWVASRVAATLAHRAMAA
jgi:very-short-patch-repair endonuclease